MLNFLSTILLVVISLYLYVRWISKKSRSFFDKHGIPYLEPNFLLGNIGDVLMLRKPLSIINRDLYRAFEPHKFAGIFVFQRNAIMIRDPELIRHVLVKDFVHFHDRAVTINPDIEPLSHHLLTMKGEQWKNLRIKLTSTFTSGKMKLMFPLVKECADRLLEVVTSMENETFEVKDLFARYTTDVISSCAFGIEARSLENPNSEFRTMGNEIFKFRYQTVLRSLYPGIPKKLIKLFNLKYVDQKVEDFFFSIVENTIKHRQDNNITRHDFVDSLLSLKNQTNDKHDDHDENSEVEQLPSQLEHKAPKNDIDMTIDLMAAQTFLFFTAGFETSSTTLAFLLFELASNPKIQRKVRDEINTVIGNNPEGLTYDILKDLPYVDMVIAETLRKYPPGSFLSRNCTKSYNIPDTNIIIPEKTTVIIPVYGIHTDPKYYERPEEFYPEHFTDEAKASRPHYTYMPFGDGPRICIAERFAKMQVKTGLISMIRNFSYRVSPKTILPITFMPNFGLLISKNEIWLEREPIRDNEF